MKRRHLLRWVAMLPLLSGGIAALLGPAKAAKAVERRTKQRVRPSDPSWPSAASWEKLKADVGGNLLQVHSLFGVCATEPNGETCRDAVNNLKNPYWIGDQPAGTEVSGWLDAWSPATSVFAVKAQNAADVVAGVDFARNNNLRLVVKGGAHSYLGTSNAPDSLLVWTRAMNKVTLHDAFVPEGCDGRVAPVPAVTTGAGAVWMDLYDAVMTQGGRYVQGGSCTTVGVAGLVQGGGFGWYSKGFGTAAASLLEAEIVTADGQLRIVNSCKDPDLFWAIKGGGGGTFGVITRLTLRTHELPARFGQAGGKIKALSDVAFKSLIARFIVFFRENLLNPHWGNNVHINSDNTCEISLLCQGLDEAQINQAWQPFVDWVKARPADFTVMSLHPSGTWDARRSWEASGPAWIKDPRAGAPAHHAWNKGDQDECGGFIHGYESLWLPASLLEEHSKHLLTDALVAASRHKSLQLHISKGLAGATPDVRAAAQDTPTNPAVLDACTLVIIADGEAPAYPGLERPAMDLSAARRDARAIDLATEELRKLVPHAGSYVAESNYFNDSWQTAYWGIHYSRLRAIKRKYDPDGLFFVHHGVGSEDWSRDGFTRMT